MFCLVQKGRFTLYFFVALRQAVQSFAKTCFAYMGDLSGLLLYTQIKKQKGKNFCKNRIENKNLATSGRFWNRKKVFSKNFAAFFVNGCKKRRCLV